MNSQTDKVTLIVGAGVTGLTTANFLAEAGERTLVVEKMKSRRTLPVIGN